MSKEFAKPVAGSVEFFREAAKRERRRGWEMLEQRGDDAGHFGAAELFEEAVEDVVMASRGFYRLKSGRFVRRW